MSLVKVAIAIYNVSKSFDLEKESELPLCLFPDKELEAFFKDKVSKTHLPKQLQKKVIFLIRPISFEVEKWKMRHSKILDLNVDLQKFLSWKSEGTIDRHRTAMKLIQNDILPISKSFVLACLYCLSEFAESLWIRMSELQRRQLVYENELSPSLVKYYIAKLQGRNIELRVDYCHTVIAFRYLLAQLTPEQRKISVLFVVRLNSQDTHVLRYCLSQMEKNEQAKVFENYPLQVLSCFLEWPWQPFFIEVANQLWDYLPKYNFCSFLEFILNERIVPGWKDFDYEELLLQFWCQSPSNFKDYVKQDRNFDIELLTRILNRRQFQLS
ncbi:hypothetical protein AVEN_26681-1 [Araneus ventricosus]|uniref:Uncharacterized protein n=1 Tax=Araneus ventricosus TaxID=182803 RepID=A0A4Y2NTR8_ARAVE|nr:hypothetical protein AVEN_26681-1 [Araneus ventricosus]